MKAAIMISLLIVASQAFAKSPLKRHISSETTSVEIELNKNTVICSDLGYGLSRLKILIPQLAELTVLDHRNRGAEAPCVSAGVCGNSFLPPRRDNGSFPSDIIDPNRPTEVVDLTVTRSINMHIRNASHNEKLLMGSEKVCEVILVEDIKVPVRGTEFVHTVRDSLGIRHVDDCQ